MSCSLLEGIERGQGHGIDDPNFVNTYSLNELKARGETIELVEDRLWAITYLKDGEVMMDFAIVEWVTEGDDDIYVENVWCGYGTVGNLRELRHSYFGPKLDGYIFYAKLAHFQAAVEFLKKYFTD